MDQQDVNRVLDNLWDQNPEEVLKWFCQCVKTGETLRRAERMISALEQAKVLH